MTAPLVFITGASSGIGQALAAQYAQAGWRLALVARRSEVVQAWAQALALPAERLRIYAADVQQPDSIIAAAERCLAELGLPEVVIAAAGISIGIDTAERADLEVLRDTFATNNLGLAATFHPFVTPMRVARRGTLVGIASVAAIRGLPGHGAYCASKAAVVSYCESLRVELRPYGVRVVTILPGFIDTPMTRGNPYPMPFLMPVDQFAAAALRAISRGVRRRVIPWPMGWVAGLLRLLPGAVYDRMVAGRGRKPRRGESSAVPGSRNPML
ncbi:MAG: SDR family oxidoreductase [Leptothrix sp. (in: b-proteobacteria)]